MGNGEVQLQDAGRLLKVHLALDLRNGGTGRAADLHHSGTNINGILEWQSRDDVLVSFGYGGREEEGTRQSEEGRSGSSLNKSHVYGLMGQMPGRENVACVVLMMF